MITPADGIVTIRRSTDDDAPTLRRLAELDSTQVPAGVLLLVEVDGELRAAMTLDGRIVVADPFHLTRHLVDLLEVTAHEALQGEIHPPESFTRRRQIAEALHLMRHAGPA